MYSLHAVQKTHLIVSDASAVYIIGTNLTLPRRSSKSYLRATRLPAGTVEARKRQSDVRANNLLRQLRQSLLPLSQGTTPPLRNSCVHIGLLGPIPFPPFSSVLGKIEFVGKLPPSMNVGVRTPWQRLPRSQAHGSMARKQASTTFPFRLPTFI